MWADEPDDAADELAMDFQQMIDYQAVRTHFFDEFFAAAAEARHPPTRASWPPGSTPGRIG